MGLDGIDPGQCNSSPGPEKRKVNGERPPTSDPKLDELSLNEAGTEFATSRLFGALGESDSPDDGVGEEPAVAPVYDRRDEGRLMPRT